ncbi:MAG TPA: NADH:ubiquinone reductase (Na(+)-transporting) subunit B [Kiritimatiellia bacterium]|nr:NADH:ubiquinone reductase (Na(+)-transporting) subunit B [Kiritimatiellia bacterium]HMO98580.1 NADH:ubiquinone reductase (Na(+)-transporting) subunit B [Kiritimatiellia bacterium]HMP95441.1 NADH:ubiquinone reductase (Na(+)-transporting) subunit B [Kiritimatiellia bacterium]
MKFILDMHDKVRPLFERGGKFERLYPLFEAQDTFAFTPAEVTHGAPHVRDALDIKRTMITVVLALIPVVLFGMWNVGHQYNVVNQTGATDFIANMFRGALIVMPIILTSYVVGGLWEVAFAIVRKHPINEGFLVSGLLFPLTLPPTIPLWQVALGISFGIVIGKEIFGGTGFNVLNPALTARAFLFFAYPVQITGDTVWTKIAADSTGLIEGFTGATPLAVAALVPAGASVLDALHGSDYAGFTWLRMFIGTMGGSIGETSALGCLIGAAILIGFGVGSWRIMVGSVIGLILMSSLLNLLPADNYKAFTQLPFWYHMVMGSFAFGTVYMATDPVSAAASNRGKWIYGGLIGALIVLIRVTNPAYPEGVMLAILFMNVMAPLIDHMVVQSHIRQRKAHLRKFRHA